jgi:hypothetical protein
MTGANNEELSRVSHTDRKNNKYEIYSFLGN